MTHKLTPTFDKFKVVATHAFTRAMRNNDKQYFDVVERVAALDSDEGVNSADTHTVETIQTLVETATQQIEEKYPNLGCSCCDDEDADDQEIIVVKLHELTDQEKELTGKEFEIECPKCNDTGEIWWGTGKDKKEAVKQFRNHLNKAHPGW